MYQHLLAKGFIVDKVTPDDGIEAIVAAEDIDVILLGIDGLGRKGLDLIRPIQRLSPKTEIITVNNADQMDLAIEGMKMGAFDDFMVPLDIDLLASRIQEAKKRRNGIG
ncbi:MAG: response regulator [Desulfobacterales bacterium]|nr:response regulator [Desulfobacterales bacterium]